MREQTVRHPRGITSDSSLLKPSDIRESVLFREAGHFVCSVDSGWLLIIS